MTSVVGSIFELEARFQGNDGKLDAQFLPCPYDLLSLQADASRKFGLAPDRTLAITQSLRERQPSQEQPQGGPQKRGSQQDLDDAPMQPEGQKAAEEKQRHCQPFDGSQIRPPKCYRAQPVPAYVGEQHMQCEPDREIQDDTNNGRRDRLERAA